MVITGIVAVPRKSDRFAVLADRESLGVLSAEAVMELGLHVGGDVSEDLRARIAEAALELATYDRAVRMLAARGRAVTELKRRLLRAGEPAPYVERAIERLQRSGLLNDEQFADQAARAKVQGQGVSKRRFRQEMFVKGVSRATADEALERLDEEGGIDERAAAERLAIRKAASMQNLDAPTRRRRLFGLLARRGYDSDVIRDVIRSLEDTPD